MSNAFAIEFDLSFAETFKAEYLVSAVVWIAGSLLLSWYLQSFANYNATYGSLGAAIGFMM